MCSRFCAEFRLPFFGIHEPNGRDLDLDKAFSLGQQQSNILEKIIKFVLFGLVVSTFVVEWVNSEYPAFYMAYLTRWTVVYHIVYMAFSFLTAVYPMEWTIKATWILFSLASVHGITIVLLFWITEYGPAYDLDVFNLMTHGGTFAIVIIDGFIINQTPVRLKHIVINMSFGFLYMMWSLIQGLLPVDNPWRGPEEPQALYEILNWDTEPASTTIVATVVVFVVLPIFQILFWAISLILRRYIYLNAIEDDEEKLVARNTSHEEGFDDKSERSNISIEIRVN